MGAGILGTWVGTSKAICDVWGSRTTRFLINTSLSSVSRISFAGSRPNCALLLLPQAKIVPPEREYKKWNI